MEQKHDGKIDNTEQKDDAITSTDEPTVEEKKPKKRPKDKPDEKDGRIEALEDEMCALKDKHIRLLAEYDNYRKRSQKERDCIYAQAVIDVAKDWLTVVDNIERALMCQAATSSDDTSVQQGVEMIYKQALEVLCKLGIEPIDDTVGSPFDPNLHEAVMHTEDESVGEKCISQVFLRGYKRGDQIIRHSMVQVSN